MLCPPSLFRFASSKGSADPSPSSHASRMMLYTFMCNPAAHFEAFSARYCLWGFWMQPAAVKRCNILLQVRNVEANRAEMCMRPFFRKRSVSA
jgi:hypothetical protein